MSVAEKALVLFSGGQDSAIALVWALERYAHVETIGFSYGQKNHGELDARQAVRALLAVQKIAWKDRLKSDCVVELNFDARVRPRAGVSPAFVPGRNLEFFLRAAMAAYKSDIRIIVGGMCGTDEAGFPDCRADTLNAMQIAVNLAMETKLRFETPLMRLSKCASWWLAAEMGGERLVDLILEETRTCYRGEAGTRHAWGYGCGECDACVLRRDGWAQFCREMAS